MFDKLKIENFRIFKSFSITGLKRVNILTGINNVGKTTFLESLWILQAPTRADMVVRANSFRGFYGVSASHPLNEMFFDFQDKERVMFECHTSQGEIMALQMRLVPREIEVSTIKTNHSRVEESTFTSNGRLKEEIGLEERSLTATSPTKFDLEVTYWKDSEEPKKVFLRIEGDKAKIDSKPHGLPQAVFVHATSIGSSKEISQWVGNLKITKKEDKLINLLKIVEPNLKDLDIIPIGGITEIFGDIGLSYKIPLNLMGSGIKRLLYILSAIASSTDGTVMIDEIENGFHYSTLTKVWEAIESFSREYNVQIFVATHSDEAIRAAYEAFSQEMYNEEDFVSFFRFSKKGTETNCFSLSLQELGVALKRGLEVR
ncbi:MAG: ATP/GTP-binding protein [Candidatus Heimdallarchaeota archaeon]